MRALVKPMLNLFAGVPNGNAWRRVLDERLLETTPGRKRKGVVVKEMSFTELIQSTLHVLPQEALDAPPGRAVVGEGEAAAVAARTGEMPPLPRMQAASLV